MIGKSWIRDQHPHDPLLLDAMREAGLDDMPLWKAASSERIALMKHAGKLAPFRDGPVSDRSPREDPHANSRRIKDEALKAGAADVGIAALRPEHIELDVEITHQNVVAMVCYEDYSCVLEGPDAVSLEAMRTYAKCADVATEIARFIREELGCSATAHHNGAIELQAIPVLHAAGLGELGRHGSLIHPELGSNFRPGFVTTDLPLTVDEPVTFGAQDYCQSCNLCRNNCPGSAIPDDFILTDGIKRWLTDIEKCYPYSRFSETYCHICIDVCPYIYKENGDSRKRDIFRTYMQQRKSSGYKAPKHA